jgi:hypothetical protein
MDKQETDFGDRETWSKDGLGYPFFHNAGLYASFSWNAPRFMRKFFSGRLSIRKAHIVQYRHDSGRPQAYNQFLRLRSEVDRPGKFYLFVSKAYFQNQDLACLNIVEGKGQDLGQVDTPLNVSLGTDLGELEIARDARNIEIVPLYDYFRVASFLRSEGSGRRVEEYIDLHGVMRSISNIGNVYFHPGFQSSIAIVPIIRTEMFFSCRHGGTIEVYECFERPISLLSSAMSALAFKFDKCFPEHEWARELWITQKNIQSILAMNGGDWGTHVMKGYEGAKFASLLAEQVGGSHEDVITRATMTSDGVSKGGRKCRKCDRRAVSFKNLQTHNVWTSPYCGLHHNEKWASRPSMWPTKVREDWCKSYDLGWGYYGCTHPHHLCDVCHAGRGDVYSTGFQKHLCQICRINWFSQLGGKDQWGKKYEKLPTA